jgi:hypothetical protein
LHVVVARLVEKSNSVVIAWVPAGRFFRSCTSALRHGEAADGLKLEARVGVVDMEVDGGASRSSGQSIEDDEVGDMPWRSLDEGVAGTVSWLRGGKGVGEGAQGEDGAQDCERVHVGLETLVGRGVRKLGMMVDLRCSWAWMLVDLEVGWAGVLVVLEVSVRSGTLRYDLQSSWLFDEKEKGQLGRHVPFFYRQRNLTIHLTLLPWATNMMKWLICVLSSY